MYRYTTRTEHEEYTRSVSVRPFVATSSSISITTTSDVRVHDGGTIGWISFMCVQKITTLVYLSVESHLYLYTGLKYITVLRMAFWSISATKRVVIHIEANPDRNHVSATALPDAS